MRRGASGCLCMCAWVCLRARVCRASSCLMSWEAGHRRKTVMVSCWGVVSTLWWPCFRTHTYTHKEVDGGQGGVWKEEDGVRTEDNKRRRRSSYFFFFSAAHLHCSSGHGTATTTAAAAASAGGIMLAVLATGGQVKRHTWAEVEPLIKLLGTWFTLLGSFFFFFF